MKRLEEYANIESISFCEECDFALISPTTPPDPWAECVMIMHVAEYHPEYFFATTQTDPEVGYNEASQELERITAFVRAYTRGLRAAEKTRKKAIADLREQIDWLEHHPDFKRRTVEREFLKSSLSRLLSVEAEEP